MLVLDLNMPGGSSLEAIPSRSSPDTAIVVLTMQEDPAFAREALRAGAKGYVLKQAAGAELVQAVRPPRPAAPGSTPSSARDRGGARTPTARPAT